MQRVRITGVGRYLPKRLLNNTELPALDKPITDEQIERIGVHSRGWASDEESIDHMAAAAALSALEAAGRSAKDLDFIVLANWTQRRFFPDFAARVQHRLDAPGLCV
jgi:3-oxoacyl-[acyl-carrier-protein] synthase III